MDTALSIIPASTPRVGAEATTSSPELPKDQIVGKRLLTIHSGTAVPGYPEFKLGCNVFASIDETMDGVVISSALFEEDGYGRSYDDAWRDFIGSLRDKLASLEKRETILSRQDLEILKKLRASLIRSS